MMSDDLSELEKVVAPSFPDSNLVKVVVGRWRFESNTLLSIKRNPSLKVEGSEIAFAPKEAGDHKLSLFLMCDSYLRCDQQYDFDDVDGGDDSSAQAMGYV